MSKIIIRSIAASFSIALGVYVSLFTEGSLISSILFSLGLYTVCAMQLNLFTGKCGFTIEYGNYAEIIITLIINLIAGYLFGLLFSISDASMLNLAAAKVENWNFSIEYFIKSFMCGTIMFLAVYIYQKKKEVYGIFLGVPLFILCGFQHSIANVITMGCAQAFNPALILCILGNWLGSLFLWLLFKLSMKKV